jgi:hypothetical protein
MEDLWKKFKEDIQEPMKIINEFLNEKSLNEKSHAVETQKPMTNLDNETSKMTEISQRIVLDELIDSQFSKKKSYGKLRNAVKEIMEKEHVSRAQAYRIAKKRILNS